MSRDHNEKLVSDRWKRNIRLQNPRNISLEYFWQIIKTPTTEDRRTLVPKLNNSHRTCQESNVEARGNCPTNTQSNSKCFNGRNIIQQLTFHFFFCYLSPSGRYICFRLDIWKKVIDQIINSTPKVVACEKKRDKSVATLLTSLNYLW